MYNILLKLVYVILHVIPNKKYKTWLFAQKKLFEKFRKNDKKVIWIHCSSLGEYEHIKPLIPKLKKINSLINITFFSSSGYTHFNDFDLIDQISHFPLDTKKNMKLFITLMNPMMVIISKNDVWPNMVTCLKKNNIPLYAIGCKFNKRKTKNWFIRRYYKKYFSKINHVFCEDKFTFQFIKNLKIANCSIIGNIRINQVLLESEHVFDDDKILKFIGQKKSIIYGSVEKSDYNKIMEIINSRQDLKHIIVPHEINPIILKNIQKNLSTNYILYSNINDGSTTEANILIVDKFGILKYLYKYSEIAYVGGGFDNGIHNTLEPVVYGNFVMFGPKHENFKEASWLIEKQIGKSIKNKIEFQKEVNNFLGRGQSKSNIINKILTLLKAKKQNLNLIINEIQNKK